MSLNWSGPEWSRFFDALARRLDAWASSERFGWIDEAGVLTAAELASESPDSPRIESVVYQDEFTDGLFERLGASICWAKWSGGFFGAGDGVRVLDFGDDRAFAVMPPDDWRNRSFWGFRGRADNRSHVLSAVESFWADVGIPDEVEISEPITRSDLARILFDQTSEDDPLRTWAALAKKVAGPTRTDHPWGTDREKRALVEAYLDTALTRPE